MKRIIAFLLSCIMISGLFFTVSASENQPLIIDNASLLTSDEEKTLTESAQALQNEYGIDVVILTINSLNGASAQSYADTYYDNNGYGDDGILFLLAMEEREWYISTCGDAIYAFTDYGLDQLGESILPYLSEGEYYSGFLAYINHIPVYYDAYNDSSPIDGYVSEYRDDVVYYEPEPKINFFISLSIGVVTGAIVILIMRSSMNTKRAQAGAEDYLKQGSFQLRQKQDLFLYSNVSKTRRQESSSSSSSSGSRSGGSSVHRSSSGRSHGGRGGKF